MLNKDSLPSVNQERFNALLQRKYMLTEILNQIKEHNLTKGYEIEGLINNTIEDIDWELA